MSEIVLWLIIGAVVVVLIGGLSLWMGHRLRMLDEMNDRQ